MRSMAATRLLAWTVAVPLVAPARPSHRSKLTGLQDSRVTGSFCLKLRAWIVGGLGVAQPGAGAEAEDGGQVQRVGSAGQGFLDDPVVAKLFAGDPLNATIPAHCHPGQAAAPTPKSQSGGTVRWSRDQG
jgi:hypothetical protein